MTQTKEDAKTTWQRIVAGVKGTIAKAEEELDAAGIERKALDVTPELVDGLRENLCAAFPAMCEGEGEAIAEVMQVITDALAEAQPSSDVAEERAADDEENPQDKEEDEKENELATLARQVTEMGKEYTETIKDMSEVVQVLHKAYQKQGAQIKAHDELGKELAAIKKQIGERPRRASQSPETKLDPDSKLATDLKQRTFTPPAGFEDMYGGGNNA